MKLADSLRAIALLPTTHDATDLIDAANVLDFVFNQMQSHSLHIDGTASYRFVGGWPLSSVRARSAEEALLKCVEMIQREANHGG